MCFYFKDKVSLWAALQIFKGNFCPEWVKYNGNGQV